MPDDLTDDLPNDSARSTDTSDSNQANAEVGEMNEDAPAGTCPVLHDGLKHPTQGDANSEWWPERLNLKILREEPARAEPARRRTSTTPRPSRPSTSARSRPTSSRC